MKKALVVDDTKNIRMLLQKTMEMEGFAVETAANGIDALNAIRENSFDLIFLDIKLPEMSGTEVLKKIRSENINTPVIVITAYPTVKNAVDCVQLGAITYLQKPFTADRLRNVLNQFHFNKSPDKQTSDKNSVNSELNKAFAESNYRKAIALLSELLSENPSEPGIYELLSKAYEGLGDKVKAEKFAKAYEVFRE